MQTLPLSKEIEFREALCRYLGDFIESMILKKNPFQSLPENLCFSSYVLRKYKKFEDRLEEKFKKNLIVADIWLHKYQIINEIVGQKYCSRYNVKYFELEQEFERWIRHKEWDEKLEDKNEEKLEVNKILKQEFVNRLVGFTHNKTNSRNSMISFTKKIINDWEVILTIDKGTIRTYFSVTIGMVFPSFNIDWALFGGESIILSYINKTDFAKTLNVIVEYNNFFMPHFEKAIQNSLDEISGVLPKREFNFG